jgi:glycosyltransferase involved in cell wall biosynthesis
MLPDSDMSRAHPSPDEELKVWINSSSKRNPYMGLLCSHLTERGLEVEGGVYPQETVVKRVLADGLPDVMHLHWLNPFGIRDAAGSFGLPAVGARIATSLSVFHAMKAAGTRIVWTAHNLGSHDIDLQSADRFFHRRVAELTDGIIAHSPHAKSEVVRELEVDEPGKIEVIPHGNYLQTYPNEVGHGEARERLELPDDVPVLVFVGLVRPYKNVPELLETFQTDLAELDARLIIAGSAMDEAHEKEVRAAAEGDARVQLHLEYIPDEELQFFLNAADAVVMPYRDILTSGSAVMAMSFGRPIVAPRIGTLRDVVGDDGGFLYEPDQPSGLADALQEAIGAERAELEAIGERNFERAREWSWDSVARQTHELYCEVLDTG